jgi:phosphotransferase system  glucose/maltose/N-acetylglucosamine-specific IIC component
MLVMGFSKPPGVPCPPNNPHCQGDVPSVIIDSEFWTYIGILIAVIIGSVFIYFYNKRKTKTSNWESKNINHE